MGMTLNLDEKDVREALAAHFGAHFGVQIEPNAIAINIREAYHSADQRENYGAGIASVVITLPPTFGKKTSSLPTHPDSFQGDR